MRTIKRFWQYQRLLLSSSRWGNTFLSASPLGNAGCLSILMLVLLYSIYWIVFGEVNFLLICLAATAYSYTIAVGRWGLYILVPVSKKYALLNLYLLPLVLSAIVSAILWAVFYLIFFIAWLAVSLSKIPRDSVSAPADVSAAGVKTALFGVIFVLIVILAVTAIAVIRRRKTRLIILWSFLVIVSGLLLWLKSALPTVPDTGTILSLSPSDILPSFERLPAAWTIVLCMAAALIVLAPLSVRFAYREYMCDVSRQND